MRSKLAALTLTMVVAVIAAVALTGSASAASNGGVYVVTPRSWGWCPLSGVHAVYYWNTTSGASGGDAGDDIVWAGVVLNTNNEMHVQVQCNYTGESSGTYFWIRPTRTGQAWYVGPGAGTWHN